MGKKAKEEKAFMKDISATNCDPASNWGGLAFPKIRKACTKIEATASQNTQDAQTAAIISAATDPSIGGGGAVGATDGATEPSGISMPVVIGCVFGALVLGTVVILVIRSRNAAAAGTTTA